MHYVAVLNDIVLAFNTQFSCFPYSRLGAKLNVVVVLDYLGADETFLEVGVDDTCTLRSLPSLVVGPCLHFHLACGDECLKIQQGVGFLYQSVHAALLKPQFLKKHLFVLIRLQFGNVFLGLGSDDHCLRAFFLGKSLYLLCKLIAALCRRLVNVAYIEHWLCGEQEEVAGSVLFLLRLKLYRSCVLALFEHCLVCLQHSHLNLSVLVVADGGYLLLLLQSAFYCFKVFQLQLRVDDFLVAHRVDGSIYMGDVLVLEATQHMDYGVRLAYVSKEFVAKTLSLACALHKACYIHNLTRCRHYSAGMNQFGELCQSLVGNGYHAHVWLNSTERKIRCLCLGTRQTVEKR